MLHLLTPYNVKDLRLSGHVIYVGKSSMEVAVRMESIEQGKPVQTMMLGERLANTILAADDLSIRRPVHHGLPGCRHPQVPPGQSAYPLNS